MWICMYVDGLDIRLRAIRVFDEHGNWQQKNLSASATTMTEKKLQISSISNIV